jgi:hypothetical protein
MSGGLTWQPVRGAAGVAREDTAILDRVKLLDINCGEEVVPLSSTPVGFLCMVAADGDLLCVLAKCKEEARRGQDSHKKSL